MIYIFLSVEQNKKERRTTGEEKGRKRELRRFRVRQLGLGQHAEVLSETFVLMWC